MENFDVDMLVKSILADLTVEPIAVRSEPTVAISPENEVFIDSRVVSLADIKSRLGNAKKLLLSPKSILTPSAKDEIRKRKIEVAVTLPNLAVDRRSTLWLAAQRPATFPTEILKRFGTQPESFDSVAEIVENAVKHLSDNHRGVVLSRQSAILLCETNRHTEIRAIYGFEPKQMTEDAAEVDANLLVLHPGRVVGVKMLEIIQRFFKPGTQSPARY